MRRLFSPATVQAMIALFVALGGRRARRRPHGRRRDGTITSGDIAYRSVTGADISPDSIAAGQVDESGLDAGVLQRRVGEACPEGEAISAVAQDGSVTCASVEAPPTGSSAPSGPAGGDLTGSYPGPTIADDAVSSSKIAPGAVGNADIAVGAIDTVHVANGSLRRADDSVLTGTDSIDPPPIAAGTCDINVLSGGAYANVQVGDIAYTYPPATVANGLMIQTGIRQSVAGQLQYKICNISGATINDGSRTYGIRLTR